MRLHRRGFLQLAAAAALPGLARAEDWPARPVRIVVGFAPAGVADISARLIAQWLSTRLGATFTVENRTGAGGNLAAEVVAKAPPDGYTLFQLGVPVAVNPTLYGNLNFDYLHDFVPVAPIDRVANVMIVHPSAPARTVAEFIAQAKAQPGRLSVATGGNGSTPHIFAELFQMMADVKLVTIAYRGGGPALIDMLGGQIDVMFDPLPESIAYIRAGKLRALGISSATSSPALPDVPPIGATVPGYEATGWQGLGAPRGTPPAIIERLNREVSAALADPTFKARLAELGAEPFGATPDEFGRFMVDETTKWSKVVRTAGLKAD